LDAATKQQVATVEAVTGNFFVALKQGKKYLLKGEGRGYLSSQSSLTASAANITVALEPAKVGSKVMIRRVYFDHNDTQIKGESMSELDELVAFFQANPSLKIEISGHTDSVGPADYNQVLSESRARAVMQYLISKNIDASRLTAIGVGEARPLVSNDDEEGGREINRRIEFKILEN
jgi:outer membrane protein OmpA-like peptidoglycan-associated protein